MQVMVVYTAKVSRQYRLESLWLQFVYEKERLVGCDLISLLKCKWNIRSEMTIGDDYY